MMLYSYAVGRWMQAKPLAPRATDDNVARGAQARVSVVVPTCNRSALLRNALASLTAAARPSLDVEIIVADNGSGDGARDAAREFGVRYLRVAALGAAAARNAGMRAATGEFIAFLDDDDVCLADYVTAAVRMLQEHPDLGGVVGQVLNTDSDLKAQGEPWPKARPDDGDLFSSFLEDYPQIGATLIRSSVRDTVGYLDEDLFGDEDWDWHLRLALRHRLGFIEQPALLFRQRPPDAQSAELEWMRMRYFRTVMWRNVRRGLGGRTSAWFAARAYVRHCGAFAAHFLRCAAVDAGMGEQARGRRALLWALRASPAHAAWLLLKDPGVRSTVFSLMRTRRPPSAAVPHVW